MEDGWLRRALERKRDGAVLDEATWSQIVAGYVDGSIDDAPMAALAMAVAIRGWILPRSPRSPKRWSARATS